MKRFIRGTVVATPLTLSSVLRVTDRGTGTFFL